MSTIQYVSRPQRGWGFYFLALIAFAAFAISIAALILFLDSNASNLSAEVVSNTAAIETLNTDVASLNTTVASVAAQQTVDTAAIATLTTQTNTNTTNIATNTSDISSLASQVAALNVLTATHTAQISSLAGQVTTLINQVNTLNTHYHIESMNDADQAVPTGVLTPVVFDPAQDIKTNWTTSRAINTRFIGPKAGWYIISYNFRVSADPTNIRYGTIQKNGAARVATIGYEAATGNDTAVSGTGQVFMNGTSDYVEICLYQDSGNVLTIPFTGERAVINITLMFESATP